MNPIIMRIAHHISYNHSIQHIHDLVIQDCGSEDEFFIFYHAALVILE